MGLWARRVTECCKQRLRGHPSRSLECSVLRAQEASEGNNINNWARNRTCLLAKIVDAFCPCPKNLPENKKKKKKDGLVSLAA